MTAGMGSTFLLHELAKARTSNINRVEIIGKRFFMAKID